MAVDSISLLLPLYGLSPQPAQPAFTSSRLLEEWSVAIVTALEDGSSSNPGYSRLAPDHVSEIPGNGHAQFPLTLYTRDEFVSRRAEFKAMHPGIRVEILRTTSKVSEISGRATVYVTSRVSGYTSQDMKGRESVAELQWRHARPAGWTCVRSVFIQGHAY